MFILPFPNPITAAGRSRSVLFQTKVGEINSSTKSFLSFFFCFASLIDSANEEKWRGAFTLLSARRLDTAGSAGLCRLARKSPVGLSPCHPFEWPAHFPPSLAVYYTIACLSSYLSFSPAINRRIFFVCFCSSTPVQVQVKVLSRQLRRVPARPHPDVT